MEQKITINDVTYDAEPATIEQALLGFEEHGIFTAYLSFAGSSWLQSEPARSWTPTQLQNYIQTVLKTLGVQSWDDVTGQEVFALRNHPLDKIEGFTHPSSSRAMIFSEV